MGNEYAIKVTHIEGDLNEFLENFKKTEGSILDKLKSTNHPNLVTL